MGIVAVDSGGSMAGASEEDGGVENERCVTSEGSDCVEISCAGDVWGYDAVA